MSRKGEHYVTSQKMAAEETTKIDEYIILITFQVYLVSETVNISHMKNSNCNFRAVLSRHAVNQSVAA